MEKLRVGVIGAGKMGLLHAGIFNSLENSTLSAVSEKKKLIINGLKKYLPYANVYQDYEEMLEKEDIDIAVITTPVFLHKPIVENALEHDLHIFVEKPLALNGSECKSILTQKKNSKYKTMVGYCRRFMGTYNLAKKIIENSILGNINYFQSSLFVGQVFNPGKGWLYDPKLSGGGVLMDLGSHAIDLLHYLFGDIEVVHSFANSVYNEEVEDYASVNMKFKNGVFGTLQVSWSIRNYRLPELKVEMHFDYGTVTVTEKYIIVYSEKESEFIKKGWNTYYKQNLTKNVPIDIAGPEYTLEDLHFLNCIIEDKEPLCNFKEAAKTNFVIDKIYSSIEKGKAERINYEV